MQAKLDMLSSSSNISFDVGSLSVTRKSDNKKRLEKTLAFILFQLKLVPNMASALQLINGPGAMVKVNNRRVRNPNHICNPKDVLSITTREGTRQIKLT